MENVYFDHFGEKKFPTLKEAKKLTKNKIIKMFDEKYLLLCEWFILKDVGSKNMKNFPELWYYKYNIFHLHVIHYMSLLE